MSRKKVLFLIDTLEVGGAERSLLEILPRFREIEPVICFIYEGDALAAEYVAAGVQVISLGVQGKYRFREAVSAVVRVIQAESVGLVVTTLFRSDVVGRVAGFVAQVPVVCSIVSEPYSRERWRQMRLRQRVKHLALWGLDFATARLAAHFVANSERAKKENCLALMIPARRVDVIYRGRSAAVFYPRVGSDRRNGSCEFCVVSVARLEVGKGHSELIAAFARVLEDCPSARLRLVGDGKLKGSIQKQVEDLGIGSSVDVLGLRSDIPQILSEADLFVSASHYEGLPGAVIEAMLSGLPLVLSRIGVHEEMIKGVGCGALVPVGDTEALANEILRMISDKQHRQEKGVASRNRALERFEIASVVGQHERLYLSLMETQGH